ncbi:hypothetical protein C8J57DRAFT_1229540 [Mycena rebaudengoi]|nr:hypothetical protein C8J57DRAFT_1229540 [Mycena rebaudengoi]
MFQLLFGALVQGYQILSLVAGMVVQEREKYGGGMERDNETGNSQHGRELFLHSTAPCGLRVFAARPALQILLRHSWSCVHFAALIGNLDSTTTGMWTSLDEMRSVAEKNGEMLYDYYGTVGAEISILRIPGIGPRIPHQNAGRKM